MQPPNGERRGGRGLRRDRVGHVGRFIERVCLAKRFSEVPCLRGKDNEYLRWTWGERGGNESREAREVRVPRRQEGSEEARKGRRSSSWAAASPCARAAAPLAVAERDFSASVDFGLASFVVCRLSFSVCHPSRAHKQDTASFSRPVANT